jgi:hypothetical protein
MAAMTTALTEFSTMGDSRTFTLNAHTASKPRLVIQKRKVPQGNQSVGESTVNVVYATEDSNGDSLDSKVSFQVTVRFPINGIAADVAAALATFRDIIAGDEFANTVDTQEFLS